VLVGALLRHGARRVLGKVVEREEEEDMQGCLQVLVEGSDFGYTIKDALRGAHSRSRK
jgi:hypothetical protein